MIKYHILIKYQILKEFCFLGKRRLGQSLLLNGSVRVVCQCSTPMSISDTIYFITERFTREKVINVYCIEKSKSLVNKAISHTNWSWAIDWRIHVVREKCEKNVKIFLFGKHLFNEITTISEKTQREQTPGSYLAAHAYEGCSTWNFISSDLASGIL